MNHEVALERKKMPRRTRMMSRREMPWTSWSSAEVLDGSREASEVGALMVGAPPPLRLRKVVSAMIAVVGVGTVKRRGA